MNNKTCGECRYYVSELKRCNMRKIICNIQATNTGCGCFECKQKPNPTNGDVIRQGGNRALAEFAYKSLQICRMCTFSRLEGVSCECAAERGQSCIDGIESWLNAPADCVGTDIGVLTKGSEGEDVQHS